jgi:hypothetical protein
MSRRSVLRGAAGAGALGLTAAGGIGAAAGLTRPGRAGQDTDSQHTAGEHPASLAGPVTVYLRDTSTGEMEVFAGTGQTSVRDPGLVSALLRAVQ